MVCPVCGTANREEARFCKRCSAALPQTAAQPRSARVVPRSPTPRTWWHGIGVFVLVAVGLVLIDVAANARVTWSLVAVLAAAFIVGGILMLQVLTAPEPRERRPFVVGAGLLAASVLLLPISVALQSTPTFTETYTVPDDASVATIRVSVADETGHVIVGFEPDPGFLVRARVTHIGGIFSSHFPGDVTVTNDTVGGVLTFAIDARSVNGLFFLGGHDIAVTVNERLATSLALSSTTGSLTVDVPPTALIGTGGILASVTTGDVSISTTDAAFLVGATIQGTSATGRVTIAVDQTVVGSGSVPIQGTSTTGSVTFTFGSVAGIAAKVSSTVTTGSIRFDPSKYSGASPALLYAPSAASYDAAAMKFDVNLASTTGGVDLG